VAQASPFLLIWMLIENFGLLKWYTIDEQGIALMRFGFIFKKFYFRDLISITKLSTEETRDLLYREYVVNMLLMRHHAQLTTDRIVRAAKAGAPMNDMIRYSTVNITPIGFGVGSQDPTVEDAKKTYWLPLSGEFVLLTTKQNRHILLSPRNVDQFVDDSQKGLVKAGISGSS
jgi:hypothetical protein